MSQLAGDAVDPLGVVLDLPVFQFKVKDVVGGFNYDNACTMAYAG